jgi:hypothetical protein
VASPSLKANILWGKMLPQAVVPALTQAAV